LLINKLNEEETIRQVKFNHLAISNKKIHRVLRYLLSALYNVFYLLTSGPQTLVVYNSNNPFSLAIGNILSKLLGRKILICCHAEMEVLGSRNVKSREARLIYNFFTRTHINRYMSFLVLGDSIFENLPKYLLPCNVKQFIVIDHPYFSAREDLKKSIKAKVSKIRVGISGIVKKSKGLDNLLDVVDLSSKMIDSSLLEFWAISRIEAPNELLEAKRIRFFNPSNKFLSRDEYLSFIDEVDFLYFPYPKGGYKLTASGAVFEGIFSRKPILSLANDFFKYLFEKFGSFGRLFDSNEELVSFLQSYILKPQQILLDDDISKIKSRLSPRSLSKELEKGINNIYR